MSKAHLANSALMGFQLQHEVLMVVEPRLDRLEVLLSEAVHGHQVVLGLQEPGEHLLRVPGPGLKVLGPLVTLSSLHHSDGRLCLNFPQLASTCTKQASTRLNMPQTGVISPG